MPVFSTDIQNEKSIDDQQAVRKKYAKANGFKLIKCFSDAAQSGGLIFGRDGFLSMIEEIKKIFFDAVIVEELDRLSRDMKISPAYTNSFHFSTLKLSASMKASPRRSQLVCRV